MINSGAISISGFKNALSDVLNRVAYGQERIVISSRGKPKAAVISISDLHLLEELEDAAAAWEALKEHERGETISLEELEAELAEADSALPG